MLSHQDLRRLRYFVEVVRAGSIRRGAESLRLSPAVVSEALGQLEATLGVTLLQRTTRKMQLTSTGEIVFRRAADMASAAQEAIEAGRQASREPSGPLRITLSGELCLSWFPAKLRAFETAFPKVGVAVVVDDAPVALEHSAFDIAVRAAFSREAKAQADVIDHIPLECVCAPHLQTGEESLEHGLQRIGLIGLSGTEPIKRSIWAAIAANKQPIWSRVEAPCRFLASEHVVHHRLALEGFGAALLMRPTVDDDLARNRLVPVSARHVFGFAAVSVKLRDKHPTAAARALCQHLHGSVGSVLSEGTDLTDD